MLLIFIYKVCTYILKLFCNFTMFTGYYGISFSATTLNSDKVWWLVFCLGEVILKCISLFKRCQHDTHHNDIKNDDNKHYDTQHND